MLNRSRLRCSRESLRNVSMTNVLRPNFDGRISNIWQALGRFGEVSRGILRIHCPITQRQGEDSCVPICTNLSHVTTKHVFRAHGHRLV